MRSSCRSVRDVTFDRRATSVIDQVTASSDVLAGSVPAGADVRS